MSFDNTVVQCIRDGKAFTVTTGLESITGTSEHEFLFLKNPSASGKSILVTHFKFGADSAASRTVIKIYKGATASADGTSLTITNTLASSSPPASSMEAYKNPTITDKGDILNLDISPANSPSKGLNRWYWVEPGENMLVTVDNSQANVSSFSDIYFLEDI